MARRIFTNLLITVITAPNGQVLKPGPNDVDVDDPTLEKWKRGPMRHLLAGKVLRVDDAAADAPPSQPSNPTENPFATMKVADATAMIAAETVLEDLREWRKVEQRPTVVKALDARIAALETPS